MKRDLDLIRLLLLEIEKHEEIFDSGQLGVHGYDSAQVAYHVGLLKDAGFLETSRTPYLNARQEKGWAIIGMTFAGHDYLDAVRSPRVWQKAKDAAAQVGTSLTITLAKEYAEKAARHMLELMQ